MVVCDEMGLTHEMQKKSVNGLWKDSQPNMITLLNPSRPSIKSTSRTVCPFRAKILHRRILTTSLKAS